jgi:glycine cleavage system H lipoate-binding protein
METLHEFMLITKGREYLIGIGFLVFFILFWFYLGKGRPLPLPIRALKLDDLRLRKKMFYHPGHTWLLPGLFGGNLVGIDDFLDKLAGALHTIKVPPTGTSINCGDPLFVLDLGSRSINVLAPVSGTVTMINPKMYQQSYYPQLGTRKANWLIRLEPSDWEKESVDLNSTTTAGEWLKGEVDRFRQFLDSQGERPTIATVTLADGGDPVTGVLQLLDSEGILQFENDFLKT